MAAAQIVPYSWTEPPRIPTDEEARLAEQAKAFIAAGKVTRLPYSGERYSLKFDRRTHAPYRPRRKPLSDRLAWSDVQNGMHITRRAPAQSKKNPLKANRLR